MSRRDIAEKEEIIRWQEKLLKRSYTRNLQKKRMSELIGNAQHLHSLEISAGDGLITKSLRELGGSWSLIGVNKNAASSLSYYFEQAVPAYENNELPFPDSHFDLLILSNSLAQVKDPHAFVKECHRIIKDDGWVIISEQRKVPFNICTLCNTLSKLPHPPLYNTGDLYQILKDGFDVPETISYSNSFVELWLLGVYGVIQKIHELPLWLVADKPKNETLFKYRKIYNLLTLLSPLTALFALFQFLPKHHILLKSRRRRWSPRKQPKLIDGRSIAEATINTRIGSAAPF